MTNVPKEVADLKAAYDANGTVEFITSWHGSAESIRDICSSFMDEYPKLAASTVYGDRLEIQPFPGMPAVGIRITGYSPDGPYTEARLYHVDNGLAKVAINLKRAISNAEHGTVNRVVLRKQINSMISWLSTRVQDLEDDDI